MEHNNLEALIQGLLDDTLSMTECSALHAELDTNVEARALYLDFVHLQMVLKINAQPPPSIATNVIPMDRVLTRQRRRTMKVAAICAAAAVVAVGIIALLIVPPKPPVGRVAGAPGTQFSMVRGWGSGESKDEDGAFEIGSGIMLETGTLEVELPSGVRGIVQAPAEFKLVSEDLIEMKEGVAWFEIPPDAVGFKVRTQELLVEDLGTEFGVISIPGAPDEVHVFRGAVEVKYRRARDGEEAFRLTRNEARRTRGRGKWDEIEVNAEAFLQELPTDLPAELPPHFYWGFNDAESATGGTHPDTAKTVTSMKSEGAKPKLVSGRVDKALRFIGDRSFLQTDWFGVGGADPRSVAFWIRLREEDSSPERSQLIVWGSQADDPGLVNSKFEILAVRDGHYRDARIQVRFGLSVVQVEKVISDDRWHHIAIVYSGEVDEDGQPEVQFYIDGGACDFSHELHRSRPLDGPPPVATDINPASAFPLIIGPGLPKRFGDQSEFWSELDELYIFDGTLPVGEIRKLAHP